MTINVKETSAVREPVTTPIDKLHKRVRCTNKAKSWSSGVACAEELGVTPQAVYAACNKKTKSCKGLILRYEEDVAEVRDSMATELNNKDAEIARLNAKLCEMQADAELGRAIREKEEAARKANEERIEAARKAKEKRQKGIESLKANIAKETERKLRRQRIIEQKEIELQETNNQLQKSKDRLMATETKIAEMETELRKLEGEN